MDIAESQDRIRSSLRSKKGAELALALIDEIVALHGRIAELSSEIEVLRDYEAQNARLISLPHGAEPRPDEIAIDAAQMLNPTDGFYHLEYDVNGTPFRWTGPGREFSFRFYVNRQHALQVRLSALALVNPATQSELGLLVDGGFHRLRLAEAGGMWGGSAIIPPGRSPGATTVTFVLPQVYSPEGANRTLGLAFTRLEVRPTATDAEAVTGSMQTPGGGSAGGA